MITNHREIKAATKATGKTHRYIDKPIKNKHDEINNIKNIRIKKVAPTRMNCRLNGPIS